MKISIFSSVLIASVMFAALLPFSFSSFQILNENLQEQTYFPLSSLDYVITTNKSQNISLIYSIDNTTSTQILSPKACTIPNSSSQYCYQDTLNNYIQSTNSSFISAVTFSFSQNNISKNAFIDFIPPLINFNNSINSSSKKINMNVNVTDNLKLKNSSLEITYNNKNSSQSIVFSNSYNDTTSYSLNYSVQKSGNYTVEILAIDKSGNEKLFTKKLTIEDIFGPQISNFTLTKGSQDTQFINFKIEDSTSIKNWRIFNNNTEYAQTYSQNQTQDTITQQLNSIPQELSIVTKDSINNTRRYNFSNFTFLNIDRQEYISNELIINSSQAQFCYLKNGFNKENIELNTSDSNQFLIDISKFKVEDDIYSILVECIYNNTITQKQFNVVVDTKPPQINKFDAQADDEGYITISYNVDSDTNILQLLKNSKSINLDLKKDTYVDKDVEYSDEYEYQLRVYDRAKNSQLSEEVEVSPKKVKIEFDYFTQDNDEYESVVIQGENNLEGTIEIISQDEKIVNSSSFNFLNVKGANIVQKNSQEFDISTTSEIIEFDVVKTKIQYSIQIKVEDKFSNTITKNIDIPSLPNNVVTTSSNQNSLQSEQQQTRNKSDIEESATNVSNPLENTTSASLASAQSNSNLTLSTFWIFFILIGIIISAVFFYTKLEVIKNWQEKNKAYTELIRRDTNKSPIIGGLPFSKSNRRMSFDKEIHKRIENKEKKEQQKREEAIERKKKQQAQRYKEKSLYDQKKYKDLSSRFSSSSASSFDFTSQKTKKKNYNNNQFRAMIQLIQSLTTNLEIQKQLNKDNKSKTAPLKPQEKTQKSSSHFKSNSKDIFAGKSLQTSYEFPTQNNVERNNKDISSHAQRSDSSEPKKRRDKFFFLNKKNKDKNTSKISDSSNAQSANNTKHSHEQEEEDNSKGLSQNNDVEEQKPRIDWDSYLKKKSKSKKWFLAQREVDKELKNKFK